MDRLRKQDITNNKGKPNKKEVRKQQKLEKKAKKFTETTQEKSRGVTSESAALDMLRKHIESSKEQSERSQLLHQPHEQITKLIEVRKEERKSLSEFHPREKSGFGTSPKSSWEMRRYFRSCKKF